MQSLLEKFRLHVSSERRRRREKKLPYRFRFAYVSFYFFHFRTLSYFLIKCDTSESFFFFLHFTYPSDFLSFYFGALQAWVRRFICVGRLRAEIRYRKVIFKRYKSKQILYCKINKVSFQIDRYSKPGIFHGIF